MSNYFSATVGVSVGIYEPGITLARLLGLASLLALEAQPGETSQVSIFRLYPVASQVVAVVFELGGQYYHLGRF